MNKTYSNFSGHLPAMHKPKIMLHIDNAGRCYKCTDGGVTQFGNTPLEAYSNLAMLRA